VSLESWKTVAEIVQAAITSVAVLLGGIWAYFKLVKGRTFRPRVETGIDATRLGIGGHVGLHVCLRLQNIGGSKVRLCREGTGVMISHVADKQPDSPAETQWQQLRVFDAFVKHQWIEPGEPLADELLIRLPTMPEVVEVKMRIVLNRRIWRNTTVEARRIFWLTDGTGAIQKPTTNATSRSADAKVV
jgi:hypothetical protein